MDMGIDQAGHDELVGKVDDLRPRQIRLLHGNDGSDLAVFYCDSHVLADRLVHCGEHSAAFDDLFHLVSSFFRARCAPA